VGPVPRLVGVIAGGGELTGNELIEEGELVGG